MKYARFEDLPVWKAAIQLDGKPYALTTSEAFKREGRLRDQLERAAVSVSNNIAEGVERGTTNELLTFLYIARGSAGEVRSMLCLLEHLPHFSPLKSQIASVKSVAESISRQLRGWAGSLQNSEIKGQRYLNEKTRKEEQRQKERAGFWLNNVSFARSLLPERPAASRRHGSRRVIPIQTNIPNSIRRVNL